MSELRDELEKNFASAVKQSDVQEGMLEDSQQIVRDEKAEKYTAPKSYTKQFQENFYELSPEWQEYLSTREKQTEKGFSLMGNKLNAYKWAEKLFDDRQERLKAAGFQNRRNISSNWLPSMMRFVKIRAGCWKSWLKFMAFTMLINKMLSMI